MSAKLYNTQVIPATDSMYRYALSIVHEPETARDVVQDCLAKTWKVKNELQKVEKIQAWLFRIVRNRCIEILRRNRYTDMDEKVVELKDNFSADQQVINEDYMRFMQSIIDTLPAKQRELFHLREVEEMSYQEIASTCGISESDVKVSIHRMRKRIKDKMRKIDAYGIAN